MGLWDKVNQISEERGEKPVHFSSKKELGEKRLKEVSSMSKGKLMKHMAEKLAKSGNDQWIKNMKQSRTNHAINHPR